MMIRYEVSLIFYKDYRRSKAVEIAFSGQVNRQTIDFNTSGQSTFYVSPKSITHPSFKGAIYVQAIP